MALDKTLRSDIETSTIAARKRGDEKKKLRTAGLLGDIYDAVTGKKKRRKNTIDDILDQAPDRPVPEPEPETEAEKVYS